MRLEVLFVAVLFTLVVGTLGILDLRTAAQTTAGLSIIAGLGWMAEYIRRRLKR